LTDAGPEGGVCSRPQHTRLLVRTPIGTRLVRTRADDPQMLHHRVVPGHEPFCQFTGVAGARTISEDTVHVHVTPTH
jgi:hypothetical protein